jgi:NAD(P)H-nitrite reductase large subunit
VLCTGSTPFILPLPGKELKGVVSFRDIYDVEYMQSEAGKSKKVAGHFIFANNFAGYCPQFKTNVFLL